MPKGTKKKIMAAAFGRFSQNGYTGTYMHDLMAFIRYAGSSARRHFEIREEIRNTPPDEMQVWRTMSYVEGGHDEQGLVGKE